MRSAIIFCSVLLLLFAGCASQRQKPVCAEIQYRLDHMDQSPDQRAWLKEELRDCQAQQEEYAKSDTLTNKVKKSIYELYEESKKDSSKTSVATSSSSSLPSSSSVASSADSSSGISSAAEQSSSSAVTDK